MKEFDPSQDLSEEQQVIANIFSVVRHFYPALANICDNTEAGLLLSHLNYWCRQKGQGFYRSDEDLIRDTTLTINRLKSARTILRQKDFIIARREGMPSKNHYYINYKNIIEAFKEIQETIQSDGIQLTGEDETIQSDGIQLTTEMESSSLDSLNPAHCAEAESASKKSSKVISKSKEESRERGARSGSKSNGKSQKIEEVDGDGFKRLKTAKDIEDEKIQANPTLWNSHHWREYLAKKYEQAYGVESFEYIHKRQGDGVIIGRIKHQLIGKFTKNFNLTGEYIKEYVEWVFGSDDGLDEGKCQQIYARNGSKINFAFLTSDNLISEWWSIKKKQDGFSGTSEDAAKTAEIIKSRTVTV